MAFVPKMKLEFAAIGGALAYLIYLLLNQPMNQSKMLIYVAVAAACAVVLYQNRQELGY